MKHTCVDTYAALVSCCRGGQEEREEKVRGAREKVGYLVGRNQAELVFSTNDIRDDQGIYTHLRTDTNLQVYKVHEPDTPCRAARDLVNLIEPKFITNFPSSLFLCNVIDLQASRCARRAFSLSTRVSCARTSDMCACVQRAWRSLKRDISHARVVMGLILLSFSSVVSVMRGSICPC